MRKLYEAIVLILNGIMKIWEYFKGKKEDKAKAAETEEDIAKHDEEVDKAAEEKVEKAKDDTKSEEEQAKDVGNALDDYFGGKK